MFDPFGREIRSLRMSVTQRCNLNCFYCHREGQDNCNGELSPEEIERVVEVATSLGMRKVKITGGEPLLREDIVEIIGRVSKHVEEVSMVTNGILLGPHASLLKKNGLDRVNVSLDSLDRGTFEDISGTDRLHNVLEGIREANRCDLGVKLNVVMIRGVNTDELDNMMDFCAANGTILQLIELTTEKCNTNTLSYKRYHYDLENIENDIQNKALNIKFNELHNRKKYLVPLNGSGEDGKVCEVELVRPMHNTEFCSHCSRLRLTSDGKLKPCLLSNDGLVDVLSTIRNNGGTGELKSKFLETVKNRRPYWHEDDEDEGKTEVLCSL